MIKTSSYLLPSKNKWNVEFVRVDSADNIIWITRSYSLFESSDAALEAGARAIKMLETENKFPDLNKLF